MDTTPPPGHDQDDEEFCDDCLAGLESSEHHEKCIEPNIAELDDPALDPAFARGIMRAAERLKEDLALTRELDLTHGRAPLPQVEQQVRDAIAAGTAFGHRFGQGGSVAFAADPSARAGAELTGTAVDETHDWLAADHERKRVAAAAAIEQAGILPARGYRRGGKRRKSELAKLRDVMEPTLLERRNAR